jgi:hypothetical protein
VVAFITTNFFLLIANFGIYKRVTGEYNETLYNWNWNIIPCFNLVVFCILLLTALAWICHSLRHDPHVMGNEKYMAAHLVLLTMVLVSYIYAFFFADTWVSFKIYAVIDTSVYLLMAFIMDQVNGPQHTVWANVKFVGENT